MCHVWKVIKQLCCGGKKIRTRSINPNLSQSVTKKKDSHCISNKDDQTMVDWLGNNIDVDDPSHLNTD